MGGDGIARIWDARTGELLDTHAVNDGIVLSVAFCPSGSHILTSGADDTARLLPARR